MGNSLQEYVIRLGAQIDNGGVNQLLALLDSSKLKALGASAAMAAATTAVYKFVKSATEKEFELRKLAKTQNKNVEALRAQNTALKVMGVTLKDVEKDQSLKKIYDDLRKFNSELEMPNMDRALTNVRNLQTAFWKLKSVVNYAVQAIGDKVLINLETPIKRITDSLDHVSDWFKKNFEIITSRVATVMSSFARGVLGVFEGFQKIGEIVGKLPAGIQAAGAAIITVMGFIKSGPIGQLLGLVTLVGDVMRDYENYRWNKDNGNKPGDENYVMTMNDSVGIWDIIEGNDSGYEKFNKIATNIVTKLTAALNNVWSSQEGQESLGKMFLGEGEDGQGGLIGNITKWFKDNKNQVSGLGTAFIGFITNSIREVGGFFGGAAGGLINALFGADENGQVVVPESVFTDKTTGTTFATGIGAFFGGFLDKMKQGGSLFDDFKAGLGSGVLGTLLGAIVSNMTNENGEINIDWENVGVDIATVGTTFITMVSEGIKKVKDIGKTLFSAIGGALAGGEGGNGTVNDLGEIVKSWGEEDSVLGNAITLGVTGWFGSGSLLTGIVTGLGSVLADISGKPENLEKLNEEISTLGGKLAELLVGTMNEETGQYEGGILQALGKLFEGVWGVVGPMLDPLWQGIKAGVDNLGSELWGIIGPYINYIIYQIEAAFANTPIGKILGIKPGGNTYGIDRFGNVLSFEELDILGYSNAQKLEANKAYEQNAAAKKAVELGLSGNNLFAYYLDKGGGILTPERYEANKREWGDDYTKNIDYTQFNFRSAFQKILESGNEDAMSKFASIYKGLQASGGANYWDARKQVEGLLEEIKVPVEADTSGAETKLSETYNKWQGKEIRWTVNAGESVTFEADGGRIGSQKDNVTVGEDGAEYIIPITKTERAVSLITQMLNEMGTNTIQKVFGALGLSNGNNVEAAVAKAYEGLGLGQEGTIGASTHALETAITGMQTSSTVNISAPININVNASGSDAKAIGSQVYDLAERNLIKNLMGVTA